MSLSPSRARNAPFSRPSYQIRRLMVITPPAAPVMTPAEAKEWLGLDVTDVSQDAMLTGLIEAATEAVEKYTRRALINRTYLATYDGWPSGRSNLPIFEGLRDGPVTGTGAGYLYLLKPPLVSVSKVAWNLMDGTSVDPWASSNYLVDASDPDQYGRLVLAYDATPPSPLAEAGGLQIEYVAGYGAMAADVPYALRQGVAMVMAYMYGNRGDCPNASGIVDPMDLSGAAGLVNPYRILRL